METGEPFLINEEARAAFAEEAFEILRSLDVGLNELEGAANDARAGLFRNLLRHLHTLKGAASVVGEDRVREHVHAFEERMREISRRPEPLDPASLAELSDSIEALHRLVSSSRSSPSVSALSALSALALASEEASEEGSAGAAKGATTEFLRVRPEKVDALHAYVGELVVTRLQYDTIGRRMVELRDQFVDTASELRTFASVCSDLRKNMPSRLHADLMARLGRIVESVGTASRDTNHLVRELGLQAAQAASVSTSLEDGIRELRLVPLSTFFEDYARVVRETARETGKGARLVVDAGAAEIDRAVMMRLKDALGHLVRNAVFHGIEPSALRETVGKNPTGVIRLLGQCAHGRAVVQISDDGAGIDVLRVKARAIVMGLLREGEEFGDEKLVEILSEPGFSTRDSADALAGRGIGLDVVAEAVRSLDGHFSVSSRLGEGTVFTIDVPVAASTELGILVKAGEYSFGILLNNVERGIRVAPNDVQTMFGRRTVMVDGAPCAVIPLAALVGLPNVELPHSLSSAVVLRSGKQRLVVTVHDVPEDLALVVKPLGRAFSRATHLSGAALLPDGTILPILHVPALFLRAQAGVSGGPVLPKAPRAAAAKSTMQARSVLVVDDSMTIRTLLRNILRTEHYEVTVAHDGRSALEALASMPQCDLVISDLEMPRMNGVELCRAIRASAQAHLPVMIVTSVGEASEKKRALDSGADAYMVKSEFQQAGFLDIVARLSGSLGRHV